MTRPQLSRIRPRPLPCHAPHPPDPLGGRREGLLRPDGLLRPGTGRRLGRQGGRPPGAARPRRPGGLRPPVRQPRPRRRRQAHRPPEGQPHRRLRLQLQRPQGRLAALRPHRRRAGAGRLPLRSGRNHARAGGGGQDAGPPGRPLRGPRDRQPGLGGVRPFHGAAGGRPERPQPARPHGLLQRHPRRGRGALEGGAIPLAQGGGAVLAGRLPRPPGLEPRSAGLRHRAARQTLGRGLRPAADGGAVLAPHRTDRARRRGGGHRVARGQGQARPDHAREEGRGAGLGRTGRGLAAASDRGRGSLPGRRAAAGRSPAGRPGRRGKCLRAARGRASLRPQVGGRLPRPAGRGVAARRRPRLHRRRSAGGGEARPDPGRRRRAAQGDAAAVGGRGEAAQADRPRRPRHERRGWARGEGAARPAKA